MCPLGLNRTDANNPETLGVCYRNGFPVNEPLTFGNDVDWQTPNPAEFGNEVDLDTIMFGNPVTWQTPDPAHFGDTVLLSSPTPPPSNIVLIAHTGATNNNSAAGTITTLGIDTTGANFIVISASCTQSASGSLIVVDNLGNTYAVAEAQSGGRGGSTVTNRLYYAFNAIVGASHTFTVSNSAGSGNADCAIAVAAFSGVQTTNPIEVGGFVGGFTTTQSIQGSPITPATAGDLIVQAFMDVGPSLSATVSIDTGFTIPDENGVNTGTGGAGAALAYIVTTNNSPLNPTWSWSSSNGATLGIVGAAFAQEA